MAAPATRLGALVYGIDNFPDSNPAEHVDQILHKLKQEPAFLELGSIMTTRTYAVFFGAHPFVVVVVAFDVPRSICKV